MKPILKNIFRHAAVALLGAAGICSFTQCDMVYDDQKPCDVGMRLRFIYDYNMENANSFMSQVDCLTVHIYDSEDKLVKTLTETGAILQDEGYRMTVDLEPGDYTVLAYGGIECEEASFTHTLEPQEGHALQQAGVSLIPECLDGSERGRLHDMFYGKAKVTVRDAFGYDEARVEMMKDTNHIRIMLQQLSWEPVDGNDFNFRIVDDNTRYDHENRTVPSGEVNYVPWARGSQNTGFVTRGDEEPETVQVGYAELSTGRLHVDNHPRLVVYSKELKRDIIDIPLNKYLLLMKSDRPGFKQMGDQEFLDRESRWNLFFFLDRDHAWAQTKIVVNDWEVRINDVEM